MDGGAADDRYTVDRYFALVAQGELSPEDRVELLDGIIVAMPPQDPLHASGILWVERELRRALGPDVLIACQLPFVAGIGSAPEPDFAILPGSMVDYTRRHPTRASLVIEISDSSLAQDRLTKSRIYAQADVPDYWIVNLRERVVEWFADPESETRVYRRRGKAIGKAQLTIAGFPDVTFTAEQLLPPVPNDF